ncbi:sugar kinase [Terrisporobacter sp.]|uniref:sugar kinase n=1 Tax=Terrisporobacter sp. TaxID=1965305 RepID=UPI002617EF40|nr:sugar kinase [Terrisporobacter sp.]
MQKSEANSKNTVLAFGEVMLRLTPTNFQRVIQAEEFDATYAGGEANVICSLSMFGHNTKLITKLPNNILGDKVIRAMNSFGVDTKDIIRGEGRLGIYFLEQGFGVRNSNVIYDRQYSSISMATKEEFDFDEILKGVKMIHISGVTPALSSSLYDISKELIKTANQRGILVSYDSNYRSKLWSLEDARKFMLEVLPYVDIAFLGILDFINILEYKVSEEKNLEAKLTDLYNELFEKYPNLKYAACTKRVVNSVNNNLLQGFFFDGKKLSSSRTHDIDILDRVGGGDAFTAGILHGILSDMDSSQIAEFATCASALKHSIKGDINMVDLAQVEVLMNCGIENINR